MADNAPKIGELAGPDAQRDAIHVAVVPLEAAWALKPGQRVVLEDGKAAPAGKGDSIGVVDPFLPKPVRAGDRVYVFLNPGSVVSLRHVYLHPELDAQQIRMETIERLNPDCIPEMRACATALNMTFESFVDTLKEAARDPDFYLHMGNNESYSDYDWAKIWRGFEILTGEKAPATTYPHAPFSCSC